MENIEARARTIGAPPPVMVEVTALTRQRLDELDRLRGIGVEKAMGLRDARDGALPSPLLTPEQRFQLHMRYVDKFDRIGRAVRQIMTLEFELLGLFEAPDRDAFPKPRLIKPALRGLLTNPKNDIRPITLPEAKDLGVRPDYRIGPMEDVVAGIRKTLGVEAPPNDPFAPPPERKARQAAPGQSVPPAKLPPAIVKLPPKPQVNRAVEAAVLALSAKLGDGFRVPPAKPKLFSNSGRINPARPPKRRRNRGPPK